MVTDHFVHDALSVVLQRWLGTVASNAHDKASGADRWLDTCRCTSSHNIKLDFGPAASSEAALKREFDQLQIAVGAIQIQCYVVLFVKSE